MGAFWAGFEKRAAETSLEKEALPGWLHGLGHLVGVGSGVHGGQNVLVRHGLLGRQGFADGVARQFQAGVRGERPNRLGSFLRSFASGATVPEYGMLHDEGRHMGAQLAAQLKEHGVQSLSPRDMVLGRALTEGRFSTLMNPRYFNSESPAHQAFLSAFNQKFGLGLTPEMVVAAQKTQHPETARLLQGLERSWQDPNSPLTSNVMARLTRGGTAPLTSLEVPADPRAGAPLHGLNYAGNMAGAAAAAVVDPVAGGINAFKSTISNPAARAGLSRTGAGSKLLGWVDHRFQDKPIQEAVDAGRAGAGVSRGKQLVDNYVVNPLPAQLSNTANGLTRAVATNPVGAAAVTAADAGRELKKHPSFQPGVRRTPALAPTAPSAAIKPPKKEAA